MDIIINCIWCLTATKVSAWLLSCSSSPCKSFALLVVQRSSSTSSILFSPIALIAHRGAVLSSTAVTPSTPTLLSVWPCILPPCAISSPATTLAAYLVRILSSSLLVQAEEAFSSYSSSIAHCAVACVPGTPHLCHPFSPWPTTENNSWQEWMKRLPADRRRGTAPCLPLHPDP